MIFKTLEHQVSYTLYYMNLVSGDVLWMNTLIYTQTTSETVTNNYALCHSVWMTLPGEGPHSFK